MTGVHMLIGVGEAVITALVLSTVSMARPDLIDSVPAGQRRSYAPVLVYGGLIALGMALFVSPFASSSPDGLDKTAKLLGFSGKAASSVTAPMPEYRITGIPLATSIAGAIGTIIVFGGAWVLARSLVRKGTAIPENAESSPQPTA